MPIDLTSLNENQLAAVTWGEGPLLVLAGPGSGKTKVLALRVARLLLESPGKRFRVLGLTFTNKAAAEMRSRVEDTIGHLIDRALLTTFHSFSAEILRQHGSHLDLRPDFAILTQESDRESVLLDAIAVLNSNGEEFSAEDVRLLPTLDRLLANCAPAEEASKFFPDEELGLRVQKLYREYRRQLITGNRMDFASLLIETHDLLVNRPAVAKQLRTMYSHVCVDEFQDTNLAQYRILRDLIGDDPRNLFVVADDDQIIYQWNGASPERLRALRADFNMEVLQLPANYRCPPEVIVLANKLISFNLDRSKDKKPIVAVRPSTGSLETVRLMRFENEVTEATWIANDIATHRPKETGRCAVLARGRRLLEIVSGALMERDVPASLAVRKNEFESRGPVAWLHATLRLANARSDREQLRRMCKGFYELEGISLDVRDLTALGSALGGDFLKAFAQAAADREELDPSSRKLLKELEKTLGEKLDFRRFITKAFEWFDEKERTLAGHAPEGFTDYREERSAWEQIQADILRKYGTEDATLNVFLQELDLAEKSAPIPPEAVRCLTIHSAKGLEWDHVYLSGLAEDQLPSYQSIKKGPESREMQEERRNCFVAVTRAQTSLTLTFAESYFGWNKAPSRFLGEMGMFKG